MNIFTRSLGRSGIEVSALGVGCWAIGGPAWREESPVGWGDVDDAVSVSALEAALDAGVTFFDTADAYGAGHSERIVGRLSPRNVIRLLSRRDRRYRTVSPTIPGSSPRGNGRSRESSTAHPMVTMPSSGPCGWIPTHGKWYESGILTRKATITDRRFGGSPAGATASTTHDIPRAAY